MVTLDNKSLLLSPVHPIKLEKAEEYMLDIDSIRNATTGIVDAMGSNLFFEEATQMLINAIKLFQDGYFDCAFYSLRESIELSIGTIYLTSRKDKISDWKNQRKGFETGRMTKFLKEHETVFQEVRKKLSDFFEKVRSVEGKINKYVHKQGYTTFYTVRRGTKANNQRKQDITTEFEEYLKVCIGAVAVYRLIIDAMPIALMDENNMMRSPDLMTTPYSDEFVDKYIGRDVIDAYKKTSFYKGYKEFFESRPKQNKAVYDLIHWQAFDRSKAQDIISQIDQLSTEDRIAALLFLSSPKISNVYVGGYDWYFSDVHSERKSRQVTLGAEAFLKYFNGTEDFNMPYENVFISRCKIKGEYTYFEHNAVLSEKEIALINQFSAEFTETLINTERGFSEWYEENKGKSS